MSDFDLTIEDTQFSAIQFEGHRELKPCPFCGSVWDGAIVGDSSIKTGLYVYDNAPSSDMRGWAHVVCLTCGCGQNSVRKWNTRSKKVVLNKLFNELSGGF